MNIKLLNNLAKVPTRGSEDAAGWDLYAAIDEPVMIQPHCTVKISTGVAMEIPKGCFGGIFARSGIATKRGLRPANCTAVIDADYRGDIIVPMHNDSNEIKAVAPGERIAQIIILPFVSVFMEPVDELSETARGDAGFGSSGTN